MKGTSQSPEKSFALISIEVNIDFIMPCWSSSMHDSSALLAFAFPTFAFLQRSSLAMVPLISILSPLSAVPFTPLSSSSLKEASSKMHSAMQELVQPSSLILFPSSHSSPASNLLLPQRLQDVGAGMQSSIGPKLLKNVQKFPFPKSLVHSFFVQRTLLAEPRSLHVSHSAQ